MCITTRSVTHACCAVMRVLSIPWGRSSPEKPEPKPPPKERSDGMNLAGRYQALLDSGKFENQAALARHLGVSRARVTQVLRRVRQNRHVG